MLITYYPIMQKQPFMAIVDFCLLITFHLGAERWWGGPGSLDRLPILPSKDWDHQQRGYVSLWFLKKANNLCVSSLTVVCLEIIHLKSMLECQVTFSNTQIFEIYEFSLSPQHCSGYSACRITCKTVRTVKPIRLTGHCFFPPRNLHSPILWWGNKMCEKNSYQINAWGCERTGKKLVVFCCSLGRAVLGTVGCDQTVLCFCVVKKGLDCTCEGSYCSC